MPPRRRRTPYETLGVAPDADEAAIKAAFRAKAKTTHPDAGGSREAFEEIAGAHLILADPKRRERYDRTGDDAPEPDNEDSTARQMVASFIEQVLASDQDWSRIDFVECLRVSIRRERDEVQSAIQVGRGREVRARKIRAGLKGSAAARAPLEQLLDAQLRKIGAGIALAEDHLRICDRALELIVGVDFAVEPAPWTRPERRMNGFFFIPDSF